MDRVNIALADYDLKGTYSKNVAVAMASILYNSTVPVCCHILHDETLTTENKNKFLYTVENIANRHRLDLPHEIKFVDISQYFNNYNEDLNKICSVFSKGLVFYFCLPDALPDKDKIIVLDSDTITNLDISELWNTDMHEAIIAATHDVKEYKIPGIEQQRDNCYFNAGVLLLDLAKIREESIIKGSLLKRGLLFFNKYQPKYLDQDFLNSEFYDRVCYFDQRFDTINLPKNEDLSAQKIWHLCGRKPWNEPIGSNVELLYWKYLAKTAWRDDVLDLYYDMLIHSGYLHVHTSDCINKMKANAKREVKRIFKKR